MIEFVFEKEIKPLKTTQQVLTWLCIFPPQQNTRKLQKLMYKVFSLTVFMVLSFQVCASLAYVWKFIAIDFETSMDAAHPIMGWIPLINSFVVMSLLKQRIIEIFTTLSNIYDKRKFFIKNPTK